MFDIHQSIHDEYDEYDEERSENYIEGLTAEFAQSSEGLSVNDENGSIDWAPMMMEYAIEYIGCTPPEMTLPDFNEVLFGLFPRKVSVEADQAGRIIAELRAFWSFVARQYGLDNAQVILKTLDDLAVTRLQKKLADPANFGMAKTFFMLGSNAGFDMTTPEGVAAFQAVYNASLTRHQTEPQPFDRPPAMPYIAIPIPQRLNGDELKKKRKEKRRQREEKKRNRRR